MDEVHRDRLRRRYRLRRLRRGEGRANEGQADPQDPLAENPEEGNPAAGDAPPRQIRPRRVHPRRNWQDEVWQIFPEDGDMDDGDRQDDDALQLMERMNGDVHRPFLPREENHRQEPPQNGLEQLEEQLERRRSHRPHELPFPFITRGEFNISRSMIKECSKPWNNISWTIKYEAKVVDSNCHYGRFFVTFSGMGENAYKIITSLKITKVTVNTSDHIEQTLIFDKNHRTLMFPDIMLTSQSRVDHVMNSPHLNMIFTIHHAEKVDEFTYDGQSWPMSDKWVNYLDKCAVRMNTNQLHVHNPHLDLLLGDLKIGILSQNEAKAFYEFAGFLCHRWYIGTEKLHDILVNGFKLGFTEKWDLLDTPDSGIDFNAKALLPFYHDFLEEEPKQQIGFETNSPSGVCQIFELRMNPKEVHCRTQVETMRFAREHRGQFTFYFEDTPKGTLLMMGAVFKLDGRQNAKMKITLFEHGVKKAVNTSYRIIHEQQRTYGTVVAHLSEEQLTILAKNKLSVGIQLHFHHTDANFIHTFRHEADFSSPYMMPGPCNGWIECNDGKKIGVNKEFVSKHSYQLNTLFNNNMFADCGLSTIKVNEASDIVLYCLEIMYHKSLAINFNNFKRILDLAGYWLSDTIKRYIEMAVVHTDKIDPADKLELGIFYDLDMIKYVARHPEYASSFNLNISEEERACVAIPAGNELDGGPLGRQPVENL
ncbi:Protein CBG00185 [Caenorhabditis briggsae]|uniref:BTB domain-containing protein n=3 Tax=Caenorhabditis briggsae TaxID=6238 RepID=A0AAE9CW50_CAEBR|nr:Protein CBG00185 [Caenorhabditis briggsae]ULT83599.1 hypothetical protein L3Y34_012680 [Caenorhabditis briggsae]CAP21659.2 Protein CBG00185 [Caenorhabditis briggsae]